MQFVTTDEHCEQAPGTFESDATGGMQCQVGLIGAAETASAQHPVRRDPMFTGGVHPVSDQAVDRKQECKRRRFALQDRISHKKVGLLGRLAAQAASVALPGLAIGCIEFSDTVIGQTGAVPDRAGARLVANHAQGQVELRALMVVAVVCDTHGCAPWKIAVFLYMVGSDHFLLLFSAKCKYMVISNHIRPNTYTPPDYSTKRRKPCAVAKTTTASGAKLKI